MPGPPQVHVRYMRGTCQVHHWAGRSAVPQLELGHRPPGAPPPDPLRSRSCHQPEPLPGLRVSASRTQLRHPGDRCDQRPPPGRHRHQPLPLPPARRTRPTARYCRKLAHQQDGGITAPGPQSRTRRQPAPAQPSSRHAPPDRRLSHQRTRPARPRPLREATGPPDGRAGGCTVGSAAPARPVRGRPWKADGAPRPSRRHQRPSAIRPWTPRHAGPQRSKMTHGGTEKNGPHSTRYRS